MPPWNFLRLILENLECVFVMITTYIFFLSKLEGWIFKMPYNLHRGYFRKSIKSTTVVKVRKTIFFCVFSLLIPQTEKKNPLHYSKSFIFERKQMHLNIQSVNICFLVLSIELKFLKLSELYLKKHLYLIFQNIGHYTKH